MTRLVLVTAQTWRSLRGELARGGVTDLLTLPTLAALLDAAESAFMNRLSGEQAEKFEYELYKPGIGEIPEGFSAEDELASFGAFSAAIDQG